MWLFRGALTQARTCKALRELAAVSEAVAGRIKQDGDAPELLARAAALRTARPGQWVASLGAARHALNRLPEEIGGAADLRPVIQDLSVAIAGLITSMDRQMLKHHRFYNRGALVANALAHIAAARGRLRQLGLP